MVPDFLLDMIPLFFNTYKKFSLSKFIIRHSGKSHRAFFSYSLPFAAVTLAFAIKQAIEIYAENKYPFIIFQFPIILSSWYGGIGPGIVATILSTLVVDYYFLVPQYNVISGNSPATWASISIFMVQGFMVSYFINVMNTAVRQERKIKQQMDEFMNIASHELRTPLTSIKIYNQILRKEFRKEVSKADTITMKVDEQIKKLTKLIYDLLDTTSIKEGKIILHKEKFEFNDLVKNVVEEVQYTTKIHKIKTRLAKNVIITADQDRIGQVITNILINAVKYSPKGGEIRVNTVIQNGNIILSVTDRGVGIPAHKQGKVFEQFYRAGEGKIPVAGLGLGLYISNEFIKRHDGKIWLNSQEGRGSVFYFSLPIEKSKTDI